MKLGRDVAIRFSDPLTTDAADRARSSARHGIWPPSSTGHRAIDGSIESDGVWARCSNR